LRPCPVLLQRIENMWNQIWSHLAWYMRQLFEELSQIGDLCRCAYDVLLEGNMPNSRQ